MRLSMWLVALVVPSCTPPTPPGPADDPTTGAESSGTSEGSTTSSGNLDTGVGGSSSESSGGSGLDLSHEARRLAVGASYSCALEPSGSATCWGGMEPLIGGGGIVAPNGTFDWIIAGAGNACAGTEAASVCTTFIQSQSPPMEVPEGNWAQIELAGDHGCGLRTSGAVSCWGVDDSGETIPPGVPMTRIELYASTSCGVRADDASIECWGETLEFGEPPSGPHIDLAIDFGHGCALATSGEISCWGFAPPGTPPPGPFVDVEAGSYFGCGRREEGTIACWGDQFAPESVPPGPFAAIAGAISHACGITDDGEVSCWGNGQNGQTDVP